MDPDPPLPESTKLMGNATAGGLFGIAGGGVSDPSLPEQAGERIGPYKLREQIGEGGFGSVWVADQETPIQRRVALKIIKLGMDTKDVVARFEQERQALALMDHPNIAKVLDAGVTQWGRPYFVMELVRGIKITDYCDQANLPTVERLKLFAQVCHAVQHAHQKGIIHRDLKPSNILVTLHDGVPVPKVIDFGIAKATQGRLTDKTIYTQIMQMVGTPLYMSPEQTELSGLDVDTRSDIYSLGVLLYELLVGRTPFDAETLMKAGLDEMRRVIREQEPPKPSTAMQTMPAEMRTTVAARRQADAAKMTRLLRGDLDWIVMKALEKDRTRRYETANGFAEDIRRYLSNEPVIAAAPTAMYRVRKFARRNRLLLASISAVALALVAGIAVSTWQTMRAIDAERAAGTERKRAEKRLAQIEKTNEILASVFENLNPSADANDKPLGAVLGERLEKAAMLLDGEAIGDPLMVAKMQIRLGGALHHLGKAELAIPVLVKAIETLQSTLGREDLDALGTMVVLGEAYIVSGRPAQAIPLYEETLRLHKALLGPNHSSTLRSMTALAWACLQTGETNRALRLSEEAHRLIMSEFGKNDPEKLVSINTIALIYQNVGRVNLAMPLAEEVLRINRAVAGPSHPATLACMTNLAWIYLHSGKLSEAILLSEQALSHSTSKLGISHPQTLSSMATLAIALESSGKLEKAIPLFEESLKKRRISLGADHPHTIWSISALALAYQAVGNEDSAAHLFEESFMRLEERTRQEGLAPESLTRYLADLYHIFVSQYGTARLPANTKVLGDIASLLLRIDEFDQAQAVADRVLQLQPGEIGARSILEAVKARRSNLKK